MMKIKLLNLGSIKEAEVDLRPLTVIIGPNNSNKTYIAYSIYGLWINQLDGFYFSSEILEKIEFTNQADHWSLKIDRHFYDVISEIVQKSASEFSGIKLQSFFQDSSGKIFEKTKFSIEISEDDIKTAIEKVLADTIEYRGSLASLGIKKIERSENNNEILFYQEKEGKINNYKDIVFLNFVAAVVKFSFSDALPLPAERNAFINTYKMLGNRRYKLLKGNQRELLTQGRINRRINRDRQLELLKEQGDIRYPQPVEDFLDFLTDIELENKPDPIAKNKNDFQKLADQIEKYIQNNNKTIFKKTKIGGREIKVSVKRSLEIDLYNASSSIKQLAPLLLYLRYRAKSGDFLVIDEPEMNLHPESQVKLLESLAILVNLGVRILLTTHSPYLMAHLNNIVNGNHQNPELLAEQAKLLYLQDSRAFLKMEQVSAYEMKNNQLLSLHDPEYGIRWDTLSDVSVDIQQKFFAIYEAGQQNQETEEGCSSEEE
ncbi:AAA family ATPase [Microcystis aeruginosa CS-555/01A07]|uniref:AAA family ATPase n=1 Tax=Microcystis aeruginosa TaxID=1126 RepID=UPI00232FCC96|nr:AAA family ATPase [Microcystis aeruginosa]MDB9427570.1 AAA family ATPase [Microcystis aeruginosa CS-555/01A07]